MLLLALLLTRQARPQGAPGLSTYAASKGFVRLLTESLAVELAPFDVRCADALPGMITTDMNPADKVGSRSLPVALPPLPPSFLLSARRSPH